MKKVAFVLYSDSIGGVNKSCDVLIKLLKKKEVNFV